MAVGHGPCLMTDKRIQGFQTKCLRKLVCISYLEHKINNWVRSKVNFLVGPQEPLVVVVKRRTLAWLGMSHATTASPKPSFRAPWRVDDAMVGRGNAGWISSKSDPCPCQNCWQGPLAEKTGTGSLLNGPSCSPDDSVGQGTALNWTWCMLEARGKVLTKGFVSALGNSFAQNKVLWVLQAAGTVVLFIRIVQTASYPM